MAPIYGAFALVLAAAITGAVTWFIARRTSSGKIDTSEAATLWVEGTNMRRELGDEVKSLRLQLTTAITAITDLQREIRASRAETERAREETLKSRAETRVLMAQIDGLHKQTSELHNEVKTSNALTIGALADNTETRRILLLPEDERSDVEKEHIATAGDRQPTKDRPGVPSDSEESK